MIRVHTISFEVDSIWYDASSKVFAAMQQMGGAQLNNPELLAFVRANPTLFTIIPGEGDTKRIILARPPRAS